LNQELSPSISWSGFARGTGFIAPVDEQSRELTVKMIDSLMVLDHSFRAWRTGEKSPYMALTVVFPACYADVKAYPTNKVLATSS